MAKQLYNIFDFAQNHIGKVNGIADNSTLVKPGFAFVAIIGEKTDGHKYITSAIERGATTIIFQDEDKIDKFVSGVEYFKASDTKLAIAKLASTFYQNQPENVVAVTGTNGKSSVVDFIGKYVNC
jgi:UDP-N-acetylmuramoyl-L-alanyl-D-glutamate--2,6-diaminopimelate ligase